MLKPTFVKVSSLTDCRDGYNVYVRVVSAEHTTSQNGNLPFVRALVADETGAANAFFKGEVTQMIQKDQVIAIRNGRVKLINNLISLEIDIFGRVTKENAEVKPNTENNISEKETERPRRKPRRNEPRKQEGERKPRREDGERRENNRREGEFKEKRNTRRDDREEKRPRREENRTREDRPREDRPREDRPREDRPRRDDKPRLEWTKIGALEPADERLNITAKVTIP